MSHFFKLETVDANAPQGKPLAALRAGELHAVLVRGVYPPEVMRAAVEALETNSPGFVKSDFPAAFKAFFYGINLNLCPPDLRLYFEEEPRFRAALATLLEPGLEARMVDLLNTLDAGAHYAAPPGPGSDQRYMFTTLRGHGPGGFIPPHFDNESALRPSYKHLSRIIHPHIFSAVLAFSRAEAGGALEFFNLTAEEHADRFRNTDGPLPPPSVDGIEKVSIRLAPGDLILVNSGGYLHQVTPVEGEKTRWTACSFMAPARTSNHVYSWG